MDLFSPSRTQTALLKTPPPEMKSRFWTHRRDLNQAQRCGEEWAESKIFAFFGCFFSPMWADDFLMNGLGMIGKNVSPSRFWRKMRFCVFIYFFTTNSRSVTGDASLFLGFGGHRSLVFEAKRRGKSIMLQFKALPWPDSTSGVFAQFCSKF